jgi:DNA-binding response OmpR family regulator
MAKTPGEGPKRKILVVDDEASVRQLCIACIRHALGPDYEVVEATNGEQALEALAAEIPDLVLLDVKMPRVDGFEVCRRMKSSAEMKDVPIIFLTALGEEKHVEKGLALGGDGYVVKPFHAVTLAAQISELVTPTSGRSE